MQHTHLLVPHENFRLHSIHMCGENEFKLGKTLNFPHFHSVQCGPKHFFKNNHKWLMNQNLSNTEQIRAVLRNTHIAELVRGLKAVEAPHLYRGGRRVALSGRPLRGH